jgi:hypothetical protein
VVDEAVGASFDLGLQLREAEREYLRDKHGTISISAVKAASLLNVVQERAKASGGRGHSVCAR